MGADRERRSHVFIVRLWQESTGSEGVFYTYQSDGEWTMPVQVFEGATFGLGPSLAVDAEGTVHLVYHNEDDLNIYYTQP